MLIRDETDKDRDAIREVVRRAFGDEAVVHLVDRLRGDGLVIASLVAIEGERVVGHVMFTTLAVETDSGPIPAATLSPLAVVPEHQRRGIGSALVRHGLEVCHERGRTAAVVLGHPEYYPRFGFSAALGQRVQCRYSGAGEAFMALELAPGSLGRGGTARFPDAFDLVD